MRFLLLAVCAVTFSANAANGQNRPSPAEMLTAIADPPWRERDRVQKRFEYLLPRYVSACVDLETEIDVGDMATFTFQKINESGMNEDLLELTEGVYGVLRHAQALGLLGDGGCAEYFAMYVALRQEGTSPPDATEQIKGILNIFR